MATETVTRSHIGPRSVKPFVGFKADDWRDLHRIGIELPMRAVQDMADFYATEDALATGVTTAGIPSPVQFLQNWLPGFVNVVTTPRKIDEFVGISTSGSWEDEEVVLQFMEQTGFSVPYSDYGNVPLSSWNIQFATRTVVRFEGGMAVGKLEEARAARVKVNSADQKRTGATQALEIQRNAVGFYGYNSGDNLTYGFLNDPQLPNYVNFITGANGIPWSTKTFLEIVKDIRTAFAALRTKSQGLIDPKKTQITMGLATAVVDYLSVTTDFGQSVMDWLTKTYPGTRIVDAPELTSANGGANAFYLYAEEVNDGQSTDDQRTFMQVVPVKFRVLGVQQKIKGYEEDYTNATAGILTKRPWAIVRYSGN